MYSAKVVVARLKFEVKSSPVKFRMPQMSNSVTQWLNQLGLGEYADVFMEQQIDREVLLELTEKDFEKLGIPLGPRKKLLKAISKLHSESPGQVQKKSASSGAERRQLTILFCDLVGSTELSQKLDPEDLSQVIRIYQDTCKVAIERYDGYVARFMGDGVLAYFGYPQAHEDDAVRAVLAGLKIVGSIAKLRPKVGGELKVELAVRVGIATGPVVVGDLIGENSSQESAVVGESPNIAARLQSLALRNTVVVAPGTHELTVGWIEYDDCGKHELKGISEPVHVRRATSAKSGKSRFDATRSAALTPLVGRTNEIGLLLERWEQAKEGEGQVVLLSGEAGIGKSRITEALRNNCASDDSISLRYHCSPYHKSSALHPVIEQLERATRFENQDTDETKLDKLELFLTRAALDVEAMALFAALLSISVGDRYPQLKMPPERQKAQTLKALAGQMVCLSRAKPVLVIFEDIHWADPTSLELLKLMIERTAKTCVLMIITYRSEFSPPLSSHTHITMLTLNRFTRSLVLALAEKVTGGKSLPEEVQRRIIEKTDGVPLYVEELTKTIVESGLLVEKDGQYVLSGTLESVVIPASLQDSLMARLDRLEKGKQAAQAGAAIGREFSEDLIQTVCQLERPELDDALTELVDSGLVFQHGSDPVKTFVFKHALVQEAAYGSLLKAKRKQIHTYIAQALEERLPGSVQTEPELLAHHYNMAGLNEQAIEYWLKAGSLAIKRFAIKEALIHFEATLQLLTTLPDTLENAQRELALQCMLAIAYTIKLGAASEETERAYSRARELCKRVDDTKSMFPALWGLWRVQMTRGELQHAKELADELLNEANRTQDPSFLLEAHHSQWTTRFWLGEFGQALQHTESGIRIYDPIEHGSHAYTYGGHDPGICGLSFHSWTLWLLGFPETALAYDRRAFELAHRLFEEGFLSDKGLIQYSVEWGGLLHQLRSEPIPRQKDLALYVEAAKSREDVIDRTEAYMLQGWEFCRQGELDEGIAFLRRGLASQPDSELRLRPYYLYLLAEAVLEAGDANEALNLLQQAVNILERSGERWWESAIHRLTGEALLVQETSTTERIETNFRHAIDVAQRQGAKSLELRAAISLARLQQNQSKLDEAHDLLAPVYGWFTEGLDTTDLKAAKALLEDLA